MEHISKYLTQEIKLSSYEDKFFKSDIVFEDHMLVWFIAGETKIVQADKTYLFKKGDTFLIPRNLLATIINFPKEGLPHTSVVMHLSVERLKRFYGKHNILHTLPPDQHIYHFSNHPLLDSCLNSLIPYFELGDPMSASIADLKITEAITILREINPEVDRVLANFDVPGKVDLVTFMEKNFMFNLPLEKISYLTGRSLSTFIRDFKAHFKVTPQKWMINKRLELAYYLLHEKNKKPKDIYLEVGFEDLSHFSYAFKKKYGFAPTQAQ
ncbi:helix-turn-helix domain-containing protein [Sphingobacterium sp. MYb382]|uniref:helix-turn-helix domain-containing protein n=1 Tax=Sphingobacterium sp. MYb382 TaxID=2745278 RepID=UPI0030A3C161